MTIEDDNQDKELANILENLSANDEEKSVSSNLDTIDNNDNDKRIKFLELFTKDVFFSLLVNMQRVYTHVLINSPVKYSPELCAHLSDYLSEMNRIMDYYFDELKLSKDKEENKQEAVDE